ncbi:MAG: 30S ribosomal protein S20 [Planctomycetota bacterium]|nr:MAG: 30S ribosomal protein S20 [Planctomycetota bacterium]
MPNTKSAKRALKRSLVRRERNRGRKSAMRTWIKRTLAAVEEGNQEEAQRCLVQAQKMIDKNVKWHQIHANTAARRKSRLARAVAGIGRG